MKDKAYKILAKQKNISNNTAKDLIDQGLVFVNDKKINIARILIDDKTKLIIKKEKKSKLIYEDDKIIAINKVYNQKSENLEIEFKAKLLNRLDRETSGIILLYKDEKFRQECIEEFKKQKVFKSYLAIVYGVLAEKTIIEEPIKTIKSKYGAFSKISHNGLYAKTIIEPLLINGKKTLIKVIISTGRTHQIRVHSAYLNHGIIGDEKYAKIPATRMFLHSWELKIFDYNFKACLDDSFNEFGFDIKNLQL